MYFICVYGVVYKFGFWERCLKMFVCEDCGSMFMENLDFMKYVYEFYFEIEKIMWVRWNGGFILKIKGVS